MIKLSLNSQGTPTHPSSNSPWCMRSIILQMLFDSLATSHVSSIQLHGGRSSGTVHSYNTQFCVGLFGFQVSLLKKHTKNILDLHLSSICIYNFRAPSFTSWYWHDRALNLKCSITRETCNRYYHRRWHELHSSTLKAYQIIYSVLPLPVVKHLSLRKNHWCHSTSLLHVLSKQIDKSPWVNHK